MTGTCLSPEPVRRLVSMRFRALVVASALILPLGSVIAAPEFHGLLVIGSGVGAGVGSFDRTSGNATLRVSKWDVLLGQSSDGIDPLTDPITVALGDPVDGSATGRNKFVVAPGAVTANPSGTRWNYRAPKGLLRGIESLSLRRFGTRFRVKVALKGVDLSQFVLSTEEKCVWAAVVIGNDDARWGLLIRPGPNPAKPRRVKVVDGCQPSTDNWPAL